ncbi:DNA-binding protein [Candidatus Micrarchaeota archaeon]|nr:DNA-binding protein [Candidatus Micrarchaeota archaeon]
MQYRKDENGFVVVLEKGEKVVESLNAFFKKEGIRGGLVSGIGALDQAELMSYDVEAKRYVSKIFQGEFELCALAGNVTEKGLHAHVTLAGVMGKNETCFGGHLKEGRVLVTGEFFVIPFASIRKEYRPAMGLDVMDLNG